MSISFSKHDRSFIYQSICGLSHQKIQIWKQRNLFQPVAHGFIWLDKSRKPATVWWN